MRPENIAIDRDNRAVILKPSFKPKHYTAGEKRFQDGIKRFLASGIKFIKTEYNIRNMKSFFDFSIQSGSEAKYKLFSAPHLLFLGASIFCVLALCMWYRRVAEEKRRKLRLGAASSALALELLRALLLMAAGYYNIGRLPLHLCGMAVYISFFHAVRGGAAVGQFLYAFCMPGAAAALFFPDWIYYPPLHFMSLSSFALHIVLVSYTLMQVAGGDIRPDVKSLPGCLGVMMGAAIPIYVFDVLTETNYLFLNWPSPGSPLEWFSFLGRPGYLLGYLPMIAFVWTLLYLPFVLKK